MENNTGDRQIVEDLENSLLKILNTQPASTNPVDQLYQYLIDILQNEVINTNNIVNIILNLMKVVQKDHGKLSGLHKKFIVINVIKKLINKEDTILVEFSNSILPFVIDTIVDASKHGIRIKKRLF
jgi:hypothetical protein